jgi:alpha-L-rhamnosidase
MKSSCIVVGIIVAFVVGCQSLALITGSGGGELSAVHLTSESICDPLGIDAANPRLSWRIESTGSNVMQTAYRMVVSKTALGAVRGEGDVWDSGKVVSSKSLAVAYSGPALESGRRYYWSVMVWDNQGHSSDWAKPACWEMGLLSAKDWSGAQWITGADSLAAPLLRTGFNVAKPIARARLYIGAAGYYVASINGKRVGDAVLEPGFTAYDKRVLYSTYDVTDSIASGTNVLGVTLGRGFYAIETKAGKILWWAVAPWLAKQPLLIAKLEVAYTDQTRITVVSNPDWQTRSGPTTSNCLYRGETFDARLSASGWDTPAYDAKDWVKVWVVAEPEIVVKKALYGVLDDPAKTRDVTAAVQKRVFGDVQDLPVDAITASGDPAPGVAKILRVEYTINGQSFVASAKDFGAVHFEKPQVAINKAGIKKVMSPAPSSNLQAQTAEPMRVMKRLKAVSMTQPRPGVHVYKFPIMMAGWPRLTVSGATGTQVILRCGEKLKADGTVDNMGDAGITPGEIQRYEYTLAGQGTEVWEPQFSYAGFQYIQVDNFPGTPTVDSVMACVVHSDLPTIGKFSCSSELINNVHDICSRSVLGNLHSIPSDSPMYEKRGWCDGSLWAQAADNFGMLQFYEKWLYDIADTQNAKGNISDIAPAVGCDYRDPSWSSVFVILPWRLYEEYGDSGSIVTHYEAIKRYVDHLSSQAKGHLAKGFYGDWVSPESVEPPEGPDLVASANYYKDVLLFSKMAELLGRSADADHYRRLAEEIKQAFNTRYLDRAAGVYRTERNVGYRQTSNAMPLDCGLVPPELVAQVVSNLVADVRKRDNHLGTGSFGTAALLPALSDNGQAELAYIIASQKTYPSWGWWLANGATTTWEQWKLQVRSRNHAFLGSVDDWFYKYLAGLQPAKPGYKEINIKPFVPEGLRSASASITTPFGLVSSSWTQEPNGIVTLKIAVPPNTVAHVWVPGANSPIHVGSGQHTFEGTNSRMK